MSQIVRYKSAADYATAALQRLILSGEIPAGARLDQIDLADRLDVSRHPVRQAIERLAERGFIQLHPHRSAVVAAISVEDMDDLYLARSVIENWALTQAWGNRTPGWAVRLRSIEHALDKIDAAADLDAFMETNRAFHLAMYEPCGNHYVIRSIMLHFDLSERYQRTALRDGTRIAASRREHAAMVDAIEQDGLEELIALAARHNDGTRSAVVRHLAAAAAP